MYMTMTTYGSAEDVKCPKCENACKRRGLMSTNSYQWPLISKLTWIACKSCGNKWNLAEGREPEFYDVTGLSEEDVDTNPSKDVAQEQYERGMAIIEALERMQKEGKL
jgi:hypothetical protein